MTARRNKNNPYWYVDDAGGYWIVRTKDRRAVKCGMREDGYDMRGCRIRPATVSEVLTYESQRTINDV